MSEGGYEGKISPMVYGMPNTWKAGIEKVIIEATVGLAGEAGIMLDDESKNNIIREIIMSGNTQNKKQLIAKKYFSGFSLAHDTNNTISAASDGRIYYCLWSQSIDVGGQYYAYDPLSDEIENLRDITEICGEAGSKSISQGKSHSNFYESKGKLYVSTHAEYYEMIDGMEMMVQNPPEGYKLYPGGHILSYDLKTGEFEDLVIAPEGEAFGTMTMDAEREQIYGISWPRGYFLHYDVKKGELKNLGKISGNGEAGKPGDDYRVQCRSMFVDSRDGSVYYSTSEGDIMTYNPALGDRIKKFAGATLTDDFWANDIFWQLNVFAYTISVMMRQKKSKFKRQEHRTFIDWFIAVPAKITKSGHQTEIKM